MENCLKVAVVMLYLGCPARRRLACCRRVPALGIPVGAATLSAQWQTSRAVIDNSLVQLECHRLQVQAHHFCYVICNLRIFLIACETGSVEAVRVEIHIHAGMTRCGPPDLSAAADLFARQERK